ncbi:RTA1-domain-containing protein [Favolaschia claudopus]|uniref:RTA1-domain-containing protein n=1 Tax=Favolaschia claudopus TaxID=2862362 RepID=A0AAW0DTB1_9AGAR
MCAECCCFPRSWPMSLSRPMALSRVLLVFLLVSATQAARQQIIPRPENPFLDPKHDPYNPLRYIASNVLTAIAFALVMIVGMTQSWMVYKWGARFMLSMVIGCYTFSLGIATRFGLHTNPEGKGLYIVEYLFVVLSPCAFIASEYVLLGRIARYVRGDKHLMVNPRRITVVFVSSDIATFLIQAVGGAVSVSANNLKLNKVGSNIFLAGLVVQLASLLTFTSIFLVFLHRVHAHEPEAWAMHASKKWYQDWRALAGAMAFSMFGILIRSVYRVAELSQGYVGYLATTEGFFYGLDTLPLFIAISVYIFFWPGRIIGDGTPPMETAAPKDSSLDSGPAEPKET